MLGLLASALISTNSRKLSRSIVGYDTPINYLRMRSIVRVTAIKDSSIIGHAHAINCLREMYNDEDGDRVLAVTESRH